MIFDMISRLTTSPALQKKKTKAKAPTHNQSQCHTRIHMQSEEPTHRQIKNAYVCGSCTKLCNTLSSFCTSNSLGSLCREACDSYSMPLSWESKGEKTEKVLELGRKKEWSRVNIIQPTNSIRLCCLAFAAPTPYPFTCNKPPFFALSCHRQQQNAELRDGNPVLQMGESRVAELINLWAFCFATPFVELLRFKCCPKWRVCWCATFVCVVVCLMCLLPQCLMLLFFSVYANVSVVRSHVRPFLMAIYDYTTDPATAERIRRTENLHLQFSSLMLHSL